MEGDMDDLQFVDNLNIETPVTSVTPPSVSSQQSIPPEISKPPALSSSIAGVAPTTSTLPSMIVTSSSTNPFVALRMPIGYDSCTPTTANPPEGPVDDDTSSNSNTQIAEEIPCSMDTGSTMAQCDSSSNHMPMISAVTQQNVNTTTTTSQPSTSIAEVDPEPVATLQSTEDNLTPSQQTANNTGDHVISASGDGATAAVDAMSMDVDSASVADTASVDIDTVSNTGETVNSTHHPADAFDEDTTSTVISALSNPPLNTEFSGPSASHMSRSTSLESQSKSSEHSDMGHSQVHGDNSVDFEKMDTGKADGDTKGSDKDPKDHAVEEGEMAKAQVVKHFIEGFTIEESTQPFPVHRSSLLTDMHLHIKKKIPRRRTIGVPNSHSTRTPIAPSRSTAGSVTPTPTATPLSPSSVFIPGNQPDPLQPKPTRRPVPAPEGDFMCTLCKKVCTNVAYYRNEAFCSKTCAHRKRKQLFSQPGAPQPKRGRPFGSMTRSKPTLRNNNTAIGMQIYKSRAGSANSERSITPNGTRVKQEPDTYPATTADMPTSSGRYPSENGYDSGDSAICGSDVFVDGYKRGDVIHWTVSDVRDFIQTLEGCERYALVFEEEEIDGRALLLLNEDHLLNALDIKLGPAVKIISQINSFSDKTSHACE